MPKTSPTPADTTPAGGDPASAPPPSYDHWQFAVQAAKDRHPRVAAALAERPPALTLREEIVVRLRFGFVDGTEKSTSDIAMRVGTSAHTAARTLRSGLITLLADDLTHPPSHRRSAPCPVDDEGLPTVDRLVADKGGAIWHRARSHEWISLDNNNSIRWPPHSANPYSRGQILCAAPPMLSTAYCGRRLDLVGWSWDYFDFRGTVDGTVYQVTHQIRTDPIEDTVEALIDRVQIMPRADPMSVGTEDEHDDEQRALPQAPEALALLRVIDQFLRPETRQALVRALVGAENPVERFLRDDFHMEPPMLAALRDLRRGIAELPSFGTGPVEAVRDAVRNALAVPHSDKNHSPGEPAAQ